MPSSTTATTYGKGPRRRRPGHAEGQGPPRDGRRQRHAGHQGLLDHHLAPQGGRRDVVVFYGGYYPEAGLFVRQAKDQGFTAKFMSGDALASAEFGNLAGPASDGVYMTFSPDARTEPAAASAVKTFRDEKYEPEGLHALYIRGPAGLCGGGERRQVDRRREGLGRAAQR